MTTTSDPAELAEMAPPTWLADNIARVREQIAAAALAAGRRPDEVCLVGVSKTRPAELIVQAARLGLTELGENRVQEAADKIPVVNTALATPPRWHLIGSLQTNKVRAALALFDIIQSVDSLRLAEALDRRVQDSPLPILLEVYLGDDAERPGFRPLDLAPAVERIATLTRLRIQGLMTVAPLGLSERDTQACFARLRDERERLRSAFPSVDWTHLSMGMSDDYPLAIAEGATIVRVGRALFGARP